MDKVDGKLLRYRIGAAGGSRTVKSLYGDKSWVEDLDIVNELGAHTGCVNALRYGVHTHTRTHMAQSCLAHVILHLADYSP